MNKFTKAAIAGSAGIALLMGGAGTFATWSDSTQVDAGTISSGTLKFVNDAHDGVWTNAKGDVINIKDYLVVPGDVLTYTDGFIINATGDNLSADVTLDTSNMRLDTSSPLFKAMHLSGVGVVAWSPNLQFKGNRVTVTGNDTPAEAKLSVTITFDKGADNTTQGGHINLNNIGFKLTQV